MDRITLFLDLDGVLHPDAVYRGKHGLELRAPGYLMMHAHILARILGRHPHVDIVLSTSWVRELGYDKTLSKLPESIRERVIGATWHRHMKTESGYDPFSHMTRFEQIISHVRRNAVQHWLALDDLHSGTEDWPEDFQDHLILCNSDLGLADPEVQENLSLWLAEIPGI
jgi:hypothetical protein